LKIADYRCRSEGLRGEGRGDESRRQKTGARWSWSSDQVVKRSGEEPAQARVFPARRVVREEVGGKILKEIRPKVGGEVGRKVAGEVPQEVP